MECSKRLKWNEYCLNEIKKITICPPDETVREKILEHWDHVAKPIDGMGKFETIIAKIGAINGTDQVHIAKRAVLIMCADNGIVEEGVSQSGQEVTAIVAEKMGEKQSSVGRMASVAGIDTVPVDIGINHTDRIPGVLYKRIRRGTRNFLKEPAMTEQEAVQALVVGIDLVREYKQAGYQMFLTGEMGIGNTTTSSAVTVALLGCEVSEITGRGAGLDDRKLAHKIQVIDQALELYGLKDKGTRETQTEFYMSEERTCEFAFHALKSVGGLDLAGLAGVCIGGALYKVPIILDGVISLTAALLAERLVPGTRQYLIASHIGKEPAVRKLLDELELDAVIDARMALGEGTGAVMMVGLIDMALRVYQNSTTFSDMKIEQYERYQKR